MVPIGAIFAFIAIVAPNSTLQCYADMTGDRIQRVVVEQHFPRLWKRIQPNSVCRSYGTNVEGNPR